MKFNSNIRRHPVNNKSMVGVKLIISGIQKVGIKDSEMSQKGVMPLKKVMPVLTQMKSSKMDY